MRFDRNTPAWGVLALAALFGALIWALSPGISGRTEPWDADSAYYLFALPVAGFVGGLLAGGPLWAHYTGVVLGQFMFGLLFTGAGPLMVLGLAFLAAYALLYLAGTLAGKRARVALAEQEEGPRRHLRLAGAPPEGQWLERYDGQSTEELLALRATHHPDALLHAFAEAVGAQASRRTLDEEERHLLAVADFERDMAQGGYNQFLRNAARAGSPDIVAALRAIDCPKAAELTREAIDVVGAERLRDPLSLDVRLNDLSVRRHLQECDAILAGNDEVLAERLLRWIAERPRRIVLRA